MNKHIDLRYQIKWLEKDFDDCFMIEKFVINQIKMQSSECFRIICAHFFRLIFKTIHFVDDLKIIYSINEIACNINRDELTFKIWIEIERKFGVVCGLEIFGWISKKNRM